MITGMSLSLKGKTDFFHGYRTINPSMDSPYGNHDRFLHHIGKVSHPCAPHVYLVVVTSGEDLGSGSDMRLLLTAERWICAFPLSGRLLWTGEKNAYPVLDVASEKPRQGVGPYQFRKADPVRVTRAKLEDLLESWKKSPAVFYRFFDRNFSDVHPEPLDDGALLPEHRNIPRADFAFFQRLYG